MWYNLLRLPITADAEISCIPVYCNLISGSVPFNYSTLFHKKVKIKRPNNHKHNNIGTERASKKSMTTDKSASKSMMCTLFKRGLQQAGVVGGSLKSDTLMAKINSHPSLLSNQMKSAQLAYWLLELVPCTTHP